VDINSAVGRKAGLSDEKLLGVAEIATRENLASFSEKERLVIELADAMADTPAEISDELYGRLSQEFSPEQLLELAAQIAFENYRARLNRVFNVPSDHLYSSNQIPKS
jgi:alkylhydroperoxidase family enzyme